LLPGGAYPDTFRVFSDSHGSGGPGQEVQIIDVVSGAGHNGMVPVSDEYSVSVVNLQSQISGGTRIIKVL
jgi:hypothetical protein